MHDALYLPQEQSLLRGPVRSVYSMTEKAVTAESGVCRVFDRAPVAESKRKVPICKNELILDIFF